MHRTEQQVEPLSQRLKRSSSGPTLRQISPQYELGKGLFAQATGNAKSPSSSSKFQVGDFVVTRLVHVEVRLGQVTFIQRKGAQIKYVVHMEVSEEVSSNKMEKLVLKEDSLRLASEKEKQQTLSFYPMVEGMSFKNGRHNVPKSKSKTKRKKQINRPFPQKLTAKEKAAAREKAIRYRQNPFLY